ncbi:adhesin [Streptomyces katsurahamanus]|uniref:Adhesin n=1 Tax=Streptomyces katsurahamanus TaxID=2577098 RepID=A0ABW9NNE6_9ACTN|nr:adhesin [Streptomyces katsurahamanus]
MARETVLGRLSLLSRSGKLLLAGGVVLTALALAASVVTLSGDGSAGSSGSSGSSGTEPAAGAGTLADRPGDLRGAPERIEPSAPPSPLSPPPPSPPSSASPGTPDASAGTPEEAPANASANASADARTGHPSPRKTPVYRAWAGPGCSGGGRYQEHGRYRDGEDGWYTRDGGGHRGDGCDGSFSAVPMSGSASKDSGGAATWSWYVGSGYTRCSLEVVVPRGQRDADAAGDPTVYRVLADPDDAHSPLTVFEIDQTALRGRTTTVRNLPVHDQRLTVRLLDRGEDWGGSREGAHHAAAQMRAECRD